jgi:hypothetical protein
LYVVADQLAFPLDATPPGVYRQRGTSSLQRLFRTHFPELVARYDAEFAKRLGKFRLERISKAVERFLGCGDYRRGVARIKCTNPRCKAEYFRPFSCSVFHLCPSCSQKRTLLLGEYMNEQLLLRLPHRQFVFTLPKVLRVFFRHDKRLHGEISRLIYALVRDFAAEAAGKPLRTAAVVAFQTAGAFCRWNAHWHGLFLEGGFDAEGRFVHIPKIDLQKMSSCFRQRVIAFFLERKLLDERLAKSMLDWTHSGFSVDDSIRIPATSARTREALAQYIVRAPLSLQNLLVDEGGTDAVVYRAPYSDFFKTDTKVFPAVGFLVEVLQHLPDSRCRLIRTYGLYSSRARGTWSRQPHLVRLAPEGWRRDHQPEPSVHIGVPDEAGPELSVSAKQSRAAWARLIKKIYDVDPLVCSRCRSPMKIIAVITEPTQILRILRHLVNTGKPPPGLDPLSVN